MMSTDARLFLLPSPNRPDATALFTALQVEAPNAQLGISVLGRTVTIDGVPHTVTHGTWRDLLGLTRKPPVS